MRLGDVAPLPMIYSTTNSRGMYSKIIGNGNLSFSGCMSDPNRSDHVIGEFGHTVMLSLFHAIQAHVHAILCFGSPAQIIERVIAWVTIAMYGFASFWSWANERIENEVMYLDLMRNAIFHKVHRLIRMFFIEVARFEYTPLAPRKVPTCATRPHGAVVTNSVTWEPLDVFVLCAHNAHYNTGAVEVQF